MKEEKIHDRSVYVMLNPSDTETWIYQNFSPTFQVYLLGTGESFVCPSVNEATLQNMGKCMKWFHMIIIITPQKKTKKRMHIL